MRHRLAPAATALATTTSTPASEAPPPDANAPLDASAARGRCLAGEPVMAIATDAGVTDATIHVWLRAADTPRRRSGSRSMGNSDPTLGIRFGEVVPASAWQSRLWP